MSDHPTFQVTKVATWLKVTDERGNVCRVKIDGDRAQVSGEFGEAGDDGVRTAFSGDAVAPGLFRGAAVDPFRPEMWRVVNLDRFLIHNPLLMRERATSDHDVVLFAEECVEVARRNRR
jgi:hypothetical protein